MSAVATRNHPSDAMSASAEAATILLAYAIRESEAPAGALGEALARLYQRLQRTDSSACADLLPDLAVCVRALQFHDRLMQQLAVVRNLLGALADQPAPEIVGTQRWEEVLLALRERLNEDSAEELRQLLVRTGGMESPADNASAAEAEGTVELF